VINTLEAAGKLLPIVFGKQEVPLIKIIDNGMSRFLPKKKPNSEEREYVDYSSIVGVYDSDGVSIDYEIEGLYIIASSTAKTIKYINVNVEQSVELEKIADMPVQFLVAEYITAIGGVYNSDGVALPYTRNGLVITAAKEANYAIVTGYTNNRLGDIVVQLISAVAGVLYTNTFWDVAETDAYINTSPRLNIAIKSGTVRSAVNEVLKSDMVFLVQKNNARFTLRRWGAEYGVFSVPEYLHTQQPAKNWKDAQKYWFSSCVVKYGRNNRTGDFAGRVLINDNENILRGKYSKIKTYEFETNLVQAQDARNLGVRLSARFNSYKETVQIGIGRDTSEINLLDTVVIKIAINERLYSNVTRWLVKEIDPAQDKMTLEEI
jgi:hypothetical protein